MMFLTAGTLYSELQRVPASCSMYSAQASAAVSTRVSRRAPPPQQCLGRREAPRRRQGRTDGYSYILDYAGNGYERERGKIEAGLGHRGAAYQFIIGTSPRTAVEARIANQDEQLARSDGGLFGLWEKFDRWARCVSCRSLP